MKLAKVPETRQHELPIFFSKRSLEENALKRGEFRRKFQRFLKRVMCDASTT